MPEKPEAVETTYEILSGEDSDRVCDAIPEQACKNIPKNYVLNVFNIFIFIGMSLLGSYTSLKLNRTK